jgi:hypothetical protein
MDTLIAHELVKALRNSFKAEVARTGRHVLTLTADDIDGLDHWIEERADLEATIRDEAMEASQ